MFKYGFIFCFECHPFFYSSMSLRLCACVVGVVVLFILLFFFNVISFSLSRLFIFLNCFFSRNSWIHLIQVFDRNLNVCAKEKCMIHSYIEHSGAATVLFELNCEPAIR